MEIKILGGGCKNCERLEKITREAVEELGINADFFHVKDMNDILSYDITSTPGLVVNEQVLSSGRIPKKSEIIEWLQSI